MQPIPTQFSGWAGTSCSSPVSLQSPRMEVMRNLVQFNLAILQFQSHISAMTCSLTGSTALYGTFKQLVSALSSEWVL